MEESPFDVRVFRSWLETRQEWIVGIPAVSGYCPLANWLDMMQWQGQSQWVVGREYVYAAEGGSFWLPSWAVQLVRVLDAQYPAQHLTGAEVLAVLDRVEAGQSAEEWECASGSSARGRRKYAKGLYESRDILSGD